MKLGIGNYYIDRYGLEVGASKMAEHGYSYIDYNFADTDAELYSMSEEDLAEATLRIRSALESAGILVSQIHGPWRYPPRDNTEEDRRERFDKMARSLLIAKHLGAAYVAVHPLMPYGENSPEAPDEVYAINRRFYSELAEVGARLGVTVCLENMPFGSHPIHSAEHICALVEDINHPNLKVCYDTGHANFVGDSIRADIAHIGYDLLKILHVHDNYGDKDAHNPPYDGTIDWGKFAEALFDIGYDGVMNLETSPVGKKEVVPETERSSRELELAAIARLLAGDRS